MYLLKGKVFVLVLAVTCMTRRRQE